MHKLVGQEVFVRGGGSRKMVVSLEAQWLGGKVSRGGDVFVVRLDLLVVKGRISLTTSYARPYWGGGWYYCVRKFKKGKLVKLVSK